MKKLLCLVSCLLIVLCGCGKKEYKYSCDMAHYKFGQKAVEIADKYLNYEINSSEAYDLIDDLYNSINELPETISSKEDHSNSNDVIEDYAYFLYNSLIYNVEYFEVQECRDKLFEILEQSQVYIIVEE